MQVVALAPLGVGTLLWQPDPNAWTLTVVAKATYALADGVESSLSSTPEPVTLDRHYEDDPTASLAAASDLVPFKRGAEILLVGHAHAPRGEPVMQLVARATVGEWSKSIGVVGDRIWWLQDRGYRAGRPRTFTSMSLRYERAVRSPNNPVGLDPTSAPVPGALALPNLEAVDVVAEGGVVGFGPIAPNWATRKALLAGAPIDWACEGGGAAPAGFDFGYFNAAPRDQQVEMLRPNTTITLENLHPDRAELTTKLAPAKPRVFLVDPASGRASEIAMRCDTLVIDTDRSVATLTWRGLAAIASREAGKAAMLVVAADVKGRELRAKQIERALREGGVEALKRLDVFTDAPDELSVRHDGRMIKEAAGLLEDPPTRVAELGLASPELPPSNDRDHSAARDPDDTTTTTTGRRLAPRQATLIYGPAPAPIPIAVAPMIEEPSTADETTPLTNDPPRSTHASAEPRPIVKEAENAVVVASLEEATADERTAAPPFERAKGAMTLAEYARLAVCVERGEVSRALADFAIELSDLFELQRIWTQRLADDPALVTALAEAMEAARWE